MQPEKTVVLPAITFRIVKAKFKGHGKAHATYVANICVPRTQHISLDTKAYKMILSGNPKTLRLKGLWLTPNTQSRLLNFTTPKAKLKLRICLENILCLSLAITV